MPLRHYPINKQMTPQELKQQVREILGNVEFLSGVPVPAPGKTILQVESIIDKTVQMTEERIMGIITNLQEDGLNVQIEGDYYINFRDLEYFITTKSGINK